MYSEAVCCSLPPLDQIAKRDIHYPLAFFPMMIWIIWFICFSGFVIVNNVKEEVYV